MNNKINYADHLEKKVGELLTRHGIKFSHESQHKKNMLPLDFYLPDYDIYIEVKQFPSERTDGQLNQHENVILLQGKNSIAFLENLLKTIAP